MTLIVDASVAIKWVISEAGSDRAAALFDSDALAAPSFWLVEAANALWKHWRRKMLSGEEVRERIRALAALPIESIEDGALVDTAVGFSIGIDHPVYDCHYLAAAVLRNTALVTADALFFAKVSGSPFAAHIRLL